MPLNKWLVAWYLLGSNEKRFGAEQLQRALGDGTYRTTWFMMHRIRYALADPLFPRKLGDGTNGGCSIVGADAKYIGGQVKGMGRACKRNKTTVVTVLERGGKARSTAMAKVTGRNLATILARHFDPAARLMTDEYPGYWKPSRRYYSDKTACRARDRHVRGNVHTNSAEDFVANLKRGISAIWHHVGSHNLRQCLAEVDFCYNTRDASDGHWTIAELREAEGKRLILWRPQNTTY